MIAGVILAGGRSSRMGGGHKALRPLGGRPLLAHLIDRFRPQVSHLALNANGDAAPFALFGAPVIPDSAPDYSGPLAGVLAGMMWAAEAPGTSALATSACDTPFIPVDLVRRLSDAAGEHPDRVAIAASAGSLHPVAALWPLSARTALEGFLSRPDSRKVLDFARQLGVIEVEFPLVETSAGQADPFFNVNTPADLALAEKLDRNMHQ
jgi:molybdenum cofactor guanylyltransferase